MFKLNRSFVPSVVVAAGIACGAASADAALLVDLRAADGSKTVTATAGSSFTLDLFVTLPNGNGNANDDGFQRLIGSVLSSNGGLPTSVTSAVAVAPFDGNFHQDTDNVPSTSSFPLIVPNDLDGDGDLDLGSNNNAATDNFLYLRANAIQAGESFKLATLTFSVPLSAGDGSTDANYRLATRTDAGLWREDNQAKTVGGSGATLGVVNIGAPVTLSVSAVPEPTSAALIGLTGLCLLRRVRKV